MVLEYISRTVLSSFLLMNLFVFCSFDWNNLLRSYQRSFNGFAAKLTEVEARRLAGMDGVVSVFTSKKNKLHTTRSWDFMAFPQDVERSDLESDIIMGVLDTGIWPESASFNDRGFGPPPAKWKGICQSSENFTCNNKVIGAKAYNLDGRYDASPRDTMGHGSHTASTAAGNSVVGASLYNLGSGTARGGVPGARIAAYKICATSYCFDQDILAAFDDAIADGVDLISISVGFPLPRPFFQDSISIGSFHAMKNGILTSTSAGNTGPEQNSVCNFWPWSLTVAASTIDRKFVTALHLGNNATFEGVSINTFSPWNEPRDLIYAGDAPNTQKGFDTKLSRYCVIPDSLDSALVKDKIVFCDVINGGEAQLMAGAAGTVVQDRGLRDVALNFPLPASSLNVEDGAEVLSYLNSASKPTAMFGKTVTLADEEAPKVLSVSSRGPNPLTPDILKPDLTAPGVNILAAWSEAAPLSGVEGDRRQWPFNIASGTSMSCPHAAGAAAYVKSFHPTWSPAAIKSALMTTAFPMNVASSEDAEFGFGSGHINPSKAICPGLVYDAGVADYIRFLCGQNYNTSTLRLITGDNSSCSESNRDSVWDLNYPSFSLSTASPGTKVTRSFHRIVTNVGSAVSTYEAAVCGPSELKITVEPLVLKFDSLGQKSSFVLTVEASLNSSMLSGSLVWDDGVHQVRTPIVAHPFSHPVNDA
uniref:Cucumisin n=1 Tax=Kalanchoe fedtschenkoi TaxID=63787 RepID=A0A7N0TT03_KALFE